MRFACQSCGKAYNLPEDKIADKSNVKLKCRVCGAIVEVKKHGDVVAQILGDADVKLRVSEAPAPLTSMSADDGDDATHAIAVGDQILSDSSEDEAAAAALLGHVKSALSQQRSGLAPLPAPSPTGFGSVPLVPNFGAGPGSGPLVSTTPASSAFALPQGATPVPPPLAPPEPPAFSRPEAVMAPPLPSPVGGFGGSPPPPPLPPLGVPEPAPPMPNLLSASVQNGSNGLAPRYGDVVPLPEEPLAPVGMPGAPLGDPGVGLSGSGLGGGAAVEVLPSVRSGDDSTRKMLAALATGILIGFIIARLFF